ncbi:hybrid-cluster NAD(P)-dependent oxidoreductase [Agilicoccus flavus]|uniref:hybrid-cluster NAD(P)-dependent oxidoreductase n=1 Tax=Agilicoccus flavus TaxID=2775968 RepID=UPI001CF6D59D|nr:hybrid-cluster NAD(P)-dependent oxidoreductase [Agilicoccus flavus]
MGNDVNGRGDACGGRDAGGDVGVTAPPVWGDEVESTLVCRAVQQITPDVRSFLFAPTEPAIFRHAAGQFLTLRLMFEGRAVSRCYTISSPPTRPDLIGITVKRQPGGLVSNWLHDTMEPGVRLAADGPFGTFTREHSGGASNDGVAGPAYLFLSGGSGATPLMSMTRAAFDLAADDDIVYVHSARTPADILFRRELELMTNLAPNITVHHLCEHDAPGERWGGFTGRLDADRLRVLVPDLHRREIFCCGPAPYMAGVRELLGELEFDMARYHEETFVFEDLSVGEFVPDGCAADLLDGADGTVDPAAAQAAAARVGGYTVEFVRTGASFPCGPDEHILDAAYAAGLAPSSSCGRGMCGTCKVTILSGTVDMNHQGGIRPREIAANKVLICCSTPTSDVAIEA